MPSFVLNTIATLSIILPTAVVAAPTWSPPGASPSPQCTSIAVVANFDDLTVMSGTDLSGLPTPYQGLFYQAFTPARDLGLPALPVLRPHSPPNDIYFDVLTQTPGGTPMLTVNYPNSNTTAFDLKSMYFGCSTDFGNDLVFNPAPCTFTVAGYRGNDNQVSNAVQACAQTFQYNPSTMLGPQQLAFTGPMRDCFKNIAFTIFTASFPGGLAALNTDLAVTLDDLAYSYTSCLRS